MVRPRIPWDWFPESKSHFPKPKSCWSSRVAILTNSQPISLGRPIDRSNPMLHNPNWSTPWQSFSARNLPNTEMWTTKTVINANLSGQFFQSTSFWFKNVVFWLKQNTKPFLMKPSPSCCHRSMIQWISSWWGWRASRAVRNPEKWLRSSGVNRTEFVTQPITEQLQGMPVLRACWCKTSRLVSFSQKGWFLLAKRVGFLWIILRLRQPIYF